MQFPTRFTTHTDPVLTSIDFFVQQVSNIVKKLDPNKAYGHEKINIHMSKLSRCFATIFKNCFDERIFPNYLKKANVLSIHTKNDKQIVTNYRSVSLLPVCSKIFEQIIYDAMYKYISDINLLSPDQSGFRTGDSCITQLLPNTHDIYYSFDKDLKQEQYF